MSNKGMHFEGPDDPAIPRALRGQFRRSGNAEAAVEVFNQRWEIVERCESCGADLVREELVAHRFKHIGDGARSLARMLADAPAEVASEAVAAYEDVKGHIGD